MTLWLLALFILICTGIVGFYQGALRAAVSFVGLLIAAVLTSPLASLFHTLLPIFGLKNPLWVLYLSPVIGFVLVMIVAKVGALAVHKKVDGWYKYKANDTQRLLFERLNARVGIPMGLVNGAAYFFAITTLFYTVGYLTIQVATSEQDFWPLRLLNRFAEDVQTAGVQKAIAPFLTKSDFYYDACDVAADIYQTPLLQKRLANYPPFLMLGESQTFKPVTEATFQSAWLKGLSFGAFMGHESVQPLLEDPKVYTNILSRLGGDAKDLKTYLETGKSPKFDEERILGRWAFDFKASMNLARKRKPNMGSADIKKNRLILGTVFKDAILVATVDNKAFLKLPSKGKDNSTKGNWKTSGSSYVISIAEGGKTTDIEVTVDGRTLVFTQDTYVLVFENTRV